MGTFPSTRLLQASLLGYSSPCSLPLHAAAASPSILTRHPRRPVAVAQRAASPSGLARRRAQKAQVGAAARPAPAFRRGSRPTGPPPARAPPPALCASSDERRHGRWSLSCVAARRKKTAFILFILFYFIYFFSVHASTKEKLPPH
jgi:hypothetical protein